jgi:hypothetical protein
MVVGDTSNGLISIFPDVLVASLAGILVALVTFWLTTRRENAQARQGRVNARTLLALEIEDNASALRQFWEQIHRLDAAYVPGRPLNDDQLTAHLAAMAEQGWVGGWVLPRFSVVRWERFPASALGGLTSKQLGEIDAAYRDMRAFSDAYDKLIYISPEERKELEENMHGRFWPQRFAESRIEMYKRVDANVQRILAAKPL